ncbi:MAG: hypothetical protein IPG53_04715 [Ignavibacteriales bacterium]|nr:hypothetical protein [Ignavibacteriales bacterium]
MKLYKYNLLTIIILTLVIAGCGDKPADKAAEETGKQSSVTGFRNSQWGTTLDEVKKTKKSPLPVAIQHPWFLRVMFMAKKPMFLFL